MWVLANPLVMRGLGAAALAAVLFSAGCTVNGWRLDSTALPSAREKADKWEKAHAKLAKSVTAHEAAVADAVARQEAAQAAERAERDRRQHVYAQLVAERQKQQLVETRLITKRHTEYVTKDSNATDCGLSLGGVQLFNAHATGKGVPEAEAASAGANATGLAADNATVMQAIGVSFADHLACVVQVERLQQHVVDECLPLEE